MAPELTPSTSAWNLPGRTSVPRGTSGTWELGSPLGTWPSSSWTSTQVPELGLVPALSRLTLPCHLDVCPGAWNLVAVPWLPEPNFIRLELDLGYLGDTSGTWELGSPLGTWPSSSWTSTHVPELGLVPALSRLTLPCHLDVCPGAWNLVAVPWLPELTPSAPNLILGPGNLSSSSGNLARHLPLGLPAGSQGQVPQGPGPCWEPTGGRWQVPGRGGARWRPRGQVPQVPINIAHSNAGGQVICQLT